MRAMRGAVRTVRGRGRGLARLPAAGLTLAPGWRKTSDVEPPTVHPFSEAQGPTTMLPPGTSPISFFQQIFGTDYFDNLAETTNLNAVVKAPPIGWGPHARLATSDRSWHPTTAIELKAFVAINITMGIKELPEYKDYWATDPILHDPFVSGTMTRKRFEKLSQYIHCSIAADEDAGDKLAKVRPLITLCETNFRLCFGPSQNLSVDEAMIQFDGRLSWKQYMPKKPVKWGLKLWCLCDSDTGYCVAFNVYIGSNRDNQQANLDLGYRVVMGLMPNYLNKHHHVFADNFFTSVHLAEALLQAGTYLCGTTRGTRRDFPNTLANAKLRAGESVKWTNESDVMIVKWHDKRDICLLATNDAGGDHVVQVRRKRQLVDLSIPTCVRSYNMLMGGVDRMDQLRAYYGVGRAGRRWWKYLFWGLINVGLVNAHVLWKRCHQPLPANKRVFSLKAFKLALINDLTRGYVSDRVVRLPPAVEVPAAVQMISEDTVDGHPLVQFDGRKRACKYCAKQRTRTAAGRYVETRFGCLTCHVYLCRMGQCFVAYHA